MIEDQAVNLLLQPRDFARVIVILECLIQLPLQEALPRASAGHAFEEDRGILRRDIEVVLDKPPDLRIGGICLTPRKILDSAGFGLEIGLSGEA